MSDRINMLLESTGSAETAGDEFRGSYASRSSRSRSDTSDSGSSYSSDSEDDGSETEGEDVSMVDTYTTHGEDEYSSEFSAVEDDETAVTEPAPAKNSSPTKLAKSTRHVSIDPAIVADQPEEMKMIQSVEEQPDLDNRKRNDSNLSASRHHRVPGGAAAKLMLVGPRASSEVELEDDNEVRSTTSTESGKVNATAVNEKLGREIQEAKYEFSMGNSKRRSSTSNVSREVQRIHFRDDTNDASSVSVSGTPSFLNRNEIFHKTAAAAVAALLTPRPSTIGNCNSDIHSVCSGSVVVPVLPSSPKSVTSDSGRKMGPLERQMVQIDTQSTIRMLTEKAERVLDELRDKMHDPSSRLTDLLAAIASPENMTKDEIRNDLGYTVRRKNACGVLQVLTADTNNRIQICWTAGVLPALTSVLTDSMEHPSIEQVFPDRRIRDEYLIARIRAITVLTNLSTPAKNKIAVFHTPELIQALVSIIDNDKEGSARRGSTALLAILAKSVDNRILMFHVPGLLEAIRVVLHPKPPRVEPAHSEPPAKKLYPWSEGDDDDSESNSITSVSGSGRDDNNGPAIKVNVPKPRQVESLDGESGSTPRVKGSKTPRELTGYDDTADELHRNSRLNLFALLGHLVKEKDNAYSLGREDDLIETLVAVSFFKESESHEFAIRILANLTRHRLNKHLAFKPKGFVPALIEGTQSPLNDARLHAIYGLQNLSQEKSCRQELAISNNLIVALCDRCRNGELEDERLAAISTLKNLCDEPANLIPMTNTPGCVSTLMHFAHGGVNDGKEILVTEMMQYRACDALATLSHWLRKISTSGYALEASSHTRAGQRTSNFGNGQLFVPSLREVSWNQWQ